MQDQNLDINAVMQSFQEKVSQLTIENVVKDATIKQLMQKIEKLEFELENSSTKKKEKKDE